MGPWGICAAELLPEEGRPVAVGRGGWHPLGPWRRLTAGFPVVLQPEIRACPVRMIVVDMVALLLTAALLATAALNVHGVARMLLAVGFTTAVPGWAAVGIVRPVVDVAGAAMAVATSLTLCLTGATLMVWLGRWNPLLWFIILTGISGVLIGWRVATSGRTVWLPEHPSGIKILAWRAALRAWRHVGRLGPHDVLLPLAVVMWAVALRGIRAQAMTDYGLIPTLSPTFFAAFGLIALSFVIWLGRTPTSGWRLALHLIVLVVMLHGTTAAVFPLPDYAWVYKHVGAVQRISLYGSVDPALDIYQNWPGFFALAAWFDNVAGTPGPLSYAAWAPVYFDLLILLAVAFAIRSFELAVRLRWTALFILVAANWVAQDYFSPQALAYVLSITVLGALVTWFGSGPEAHWVLRFSRWARSRLGGLERVGTSSGRQELGEWPRAWLLLAIYSIFAATVIAHQLSPYMIIAGVGALTATGVIRPRWIVFGLAGIAILYLLTRYNPVTRAYLQFVSINPFHNTVDETVANNGGLPGRVFTANAARSLSLLVWTLAVVGAVRRFRQGAPSLIPLLLMASPAAIVFGQDYGGEATFRVFLFSLPWASFLAASSLTTPSRPGPSRTTVRVAGPNATVYPRRLGAWLERVFGAAGDRTRWSFNRSFESRHCDDLRSSLATGLYAIVDSTQVPASRATPARSSDAVRDRAVRWRRRNHWSAWKSGRVAIMLAALLALFMPAYFGLEEVNYMRPTEVAASEFFYEHARDDSVLMLATPYFPARLAANYDHYTAPAQNDPYLTEFPYLRDRTFTASDLPDIESLMEKYEHGRSGSGYLAITSTMKAYSDTFQVLPRGSLDRLDAALGASPAWRVFYRNRDAVIYQLVRPPP